MLDSAIPGNPQWNSDQPDPGTSKAPWCVYNIGNNQSIELIDYIGVLEKALGKKAEMNLLPLQPGDVPNTYANVDDLLERSNYKPTTPVEVGQGHCINWYFDYFKL